MDCSGTTQRYAALVVLCAWLSVLSACQRETAWKFGATPAPQPSLADIVIAAPPVVGRRLPPVLAPVVQILDPQPVKVEAPPTEPESPPREASVTVVAAADSEAEEASGDAPEEETLVEVEAPPVPVESLNDADFEILGDVVPPQTLKQLTWFASETFAGKGIPTPVLVVNGATPGKTLCLTAAVHGDELNGIESVRQVMHGINPEKLTGVLIGVPIVNMQGFQRHSRYLPDRRDLNRFFPGNPKGSSASRIAHSLFTQIITHCDGLVDLHTGSFHRTNLPQLRANLDMDGIVQLTQGFGSTVILHSEGGIGTLRRAATDVGIPAVTLEAGEPLRLQEDEVKHSVKALFTLLDTLGMHNKRSLWGNPEPVYYTSQWVRADQGGILLSRVKLGKAVKPGDLLGTVTDPISNDQAEIRSPWAGRVIGMALNQFVMPGFATFHVGIAAEVDEATGETAAEAAVAQADSQDTTDHVPLPEDDLDRSE